MRRPRSLFLAALPLLLAGCVTAPAPTLGLAMMAPPEPFLSAGREALPGLPMVVMKDREIRAVCGDGHACAIMGTDGVCMIVLAESVWQNAAIIEHEAAHCVGWPADHAGGHTIVTLTGGNT